MLKILVSATQYSNNEVKHQNKIHQQKQDLVVNSNGDYNW